jgi:hypothetical protein
MVSVSTRGSISLDEDVASAADRDVSSFSMCSSSVSLLLICSPATVAKTLKAVRASLEEVDVHSMWPSGGDDSASSLLL